MFTPIYKHSAPNGAKQVSDLLVLASLRSAYSTHKFILLAIFLFLFTACGVAPSDGTASNKTDTETARQKLEELRADMKKIAPFFKKMGPAGKDDWLSNNQESGETFDAYVRGTPVLPTAERRTIYIQPIGNFTAQQSQVIETTTEYIGAFYGLPVKSLAAKPSPGTLLSPDQRMIDYPAHRQILTGYILDKMLKPALPRDAAALIAFTNEDLYPESSMHFVFGQASLEHRVGVWSLYRLQSKAAFPLFLERTMKIAVHETGHMFSMRHCTKYECVMSGTNHLGETDRRPTDACPECMAKIAWMTKTSPKERYDRLARFAGKYKLATAEKDFIAKSRAVSN